MDSWLLLRFVLFFVLLFLSAVFSGAEIALFSLSHVQVDLLKEKRGAAGKIVARLLESPQKLLVTIYIGNELVNVSIAAVSTMLALHYFEKNSIAIAIGLGTFLLLVFGEITPKTFAVRYSQEYALTVARPLLWFSYLISPIQIAITWFIDTLVSGTGGTKERIEGHITEDEMKTVLAHGEVKGVIESGQREMILGVFELGDKQVDEIMTPRAEMFSLPQNEGLDTISKRASLSNYSRIPVYGKDQEHIVGILYAKDLLQPDLDLVNGDLQKILREPYFIPPTKKINELLREFRKKRTHMAVIIDEYGGVEGLVTLEDILEEVVGEETDANAESQIQKTKEGDYIVSGRMEIEEFNKNLGTAFELEDVETVGGMVFHFFGRMPVIGETVVMDGISFSVRKLKGPKIREVLVKRDSRSNGLVEFDEDIERRR